MKNFIYTSLLSVSVIAFAAVALYATYPLEVQRLSRETSHDMQGTERPEVAGIQHLSTDTSSQG